MEIINKNKKKLKQLLEEWKGHPSIADLMQRFEKLQTYTNKKFEKEPKFELIEMPYIDCAEDPVRPELDLAFRQAYGRKIFGLKDEQGETLVKIFQGGLATSGDARRYLLHEGKRYSHILNPKTGYPVEEPPRSVTVAADSCTQAGLLATLAMLQGKGAEDFLASQGLTHWVYR